MPSTDDLTSEIESYLGFLIDHELVDAYELEPLNRTLSENKSPFKRNLAASVNVRVNASSGSPEPQVTGSALRPQSLANLDVATALHEARQRAGAARSLDELYAELDAFQHMPMRFEGGKGIVRFRGNPQPELLVIGDIPDTEENATGKAFAGQPGDMIDAALKAAGVYDKAMLAPCVFWRPAGGRPLTAEDIDLNAPFLHALIRLARPKAILLLGPSAVICVLNLEQSLSKLRGRLVSYGPETGDAALPVMASYPPQFLLKQPQAKALFWRDLLNLVVNFGSGKAS
jgi:uracil-DNA glycosylase family 4